MSFAVKGSYWTPMTEPEWERLIFQFGISDTGRGGSRFAPHAFTEHGMAMLSSVLNSESAVRVNIEIVLVFVGLRRTLASNPALAARMDKLEQTQDWHEKELGEHAAQFNEVFATLRRMLKPPP